MRASEFREDDQPSNFRTQIHEESAEQRDDASERVTTRLVDDGEKDGHGRRRTSVSTLGENIIEC